ncbi:hypothetical protein [Rhizobium sp. Rhizsp82]|uniref:hypothetical protein n=1 Tax=Rhizobium sp. Rhizsp82 TaxID=3243057 RepID=UPI0039B3F77A
MRDNLPRMNTYDRRLAAIHEAGHILVAIQLGYTATGWIHPNDAHDPLSEKLWLGHTSIRNLRDDDHRRLIAVAGMVAERLWKHGHDEELSESYAWENDLLDDNSMSESDWRMAGCEPAYPDDDMFSVVPEVARFFMTDAWSNLTGISRTLMSAPEDVHTFRYASQEHALAA